MGAPVGYTCPMIDGVINETSTVIRVLEQIESDLSFMVRNTEEAEAFSSVSDDVDNARQRLDRSLDTLKSICVGDRSEMERIRSANAKLRDWGTEQETEVTLLEKELSATQLVVENLQEDVASLTEERDTLLRKLAELELSVV